MCLSFIIPHVFHGIVISTCCISNRKLGLPICETSRHFSLHCTSNIVFMQLSNFATFWLVYNYFFTFLSRKYMLCVLLDVEKLLASIIHKITSEYLQPLTYMGGSTDCTQRHPPLDCSTAGSIFEFVSTNYFLAYSNSYLNWEGEL